MSDIRKLGGSEMSDNEEKAEKHSGKIDLKELQRLCEAGWTNKHMAEHFDCSEQAVSKKRRRHGLLARHLEEVAKREADEALKKSMWKMAKRWAAGINGIIDAIEKDVRDAYAIEEYYKSLADRCGEKSDEATETKDWVRVDQLEREQEETFKKLLDIKDWKMRRLNDLKELIGWFETAIVPIYLEGEILKVIRDAATPEQADRVIVGLRGVAEKLRGVSRTLGGGEMSKHRGGHAAKCHAETGGTAPSEKRSADGHEIQGRASTGSLLENRESGCRPSQAYAAGTSDRPLVNPGHATSDGSSG